MAVRVVAHLTSKPETVDQTREALLNLVEPTRAESGCVVYELMQNNDNPTQFTFVEEWTGDAELDMHLETDHLKQLRAQADELFASPPDIRRYTLIG